MALILSGTNGVSDVDGTAATPAIRGSDTNTGIFFPAADTIAFAEGGVESARFDSAGNLGIGTSTPGYKLHVVGGNATNFLLDNGGQQYTQLLLQRNSTMNTGGDILVDGSASTFNIRSLLAGPMVFYTSATAGSPVERARIDSSGNLLVGASSFQANSPRLYVTKSSQGNSANNIVWVQDSAATATAAMHVWSFAQTTVPSSANFVDAYYNGVSTLTFRIAGNGNVTNANNSYGPISDIKLKENIVDATPKLEKLLQVRIVNYNLKTSPELKQIGVIAQELEQVFPGLVDEHPDRDEEGNDLGTTTKSVKMSVFVPMLIKAIQEQQALIASQSEIISAQQAALEQLKADVAILKGQA